ncbi:hypothetical protein MN116_009040 [Schistosoma mekongi]|uniref:Uncharacterized protein n=1 Tax=Schistosoma mekongi TaxID=38744 RepID=A0AAE1Z626_SCHME|nr:hypothetical protein MN116_009040 [Schistosoma mekongi]
MNRDDPLSVHDNATHSPLAYRQHSLSRLLLRPQKETVVWLGLCVPSLLNPTLKPAISNIKTEATSDSTFSKISYFSTQLVGLYRLCEVLLKAYLENPVIPTLTSLDIDEQGNQNLSASNISTAGVNSNELSTVVAIEPISLRQRIRELMLHISATSWDTSQCFIIELLHLTDCIQPARIIAVIDGLINQKTYLDNNEKSVWAPRPNGDRQLWAWNDTEMKNDNIQSDHAISHVDNQETNEYGPPQVHGLLNLIHTDYTRDPRRAYQCTKFIVKLSTQNAAVVKYLSYHPEKWEPIVKWLRNLVDSESSGEYFSRRNSLELPNSYNPNDSVDNLIDIKMSDSEGIYIDISTGDWKLEREYK